MAIGVLVALAYFGILAFAGILISSAVNSLSDRGVSRATMPPSGGTAGESEAEVAVPESPRAPPPQAVAAPPASIVAAVPPPPLQKPVAAPPQPSITAAVPPLAPAAAPPPSVAAAPAPAPAAVVAISPPAPPPAAPAQNDAADLRALASDGDMRLASGDIASARLYYERAAEAGDARAARLLGNSYDPAFLARWGVRGMNGDSEEAARWYKLAGALGDNEAKNDLAALAAH